MVHRGAASFVVAVVKVTLLGVKPLWDALDGIWWNLDIYATTEERRARRKWLMGQVMGNINKASKKNSKKRKVRKAIPI